MLEFCIPVKYSGVYEFWIQSASVRDWLRLWSKKLLITDKKCRCCPCLWYIRRRNGSSGTASPPAGIRISIPKKRAGTMDRRYSRFVPIGMGDPLQRVHWKLTAKTGEMLVREFSLPKREVLLLQVDLYHPPQEKWDHCKLERLLEQTADFCWRLWRQNRNMRYSGRSRSSCAECRFPESRSCGSFLKRLCLTATKEELGQNGKQSQKQSAGKNKYPAEGSLEKGRGSGVTEPGSRRAALENRCRRNSQAGERQ